MNKIIITALLIFTFIKSNAQNEYFTDKFDQLHDKLSLEYAFTEWKNINWNDLYQEFQPLIETAETTNDTLAYYLALREYLFHVPDGHVAIYGWWDKMETLKHQQVGGSYGFALVELDNGKLVIRLISENSPADSAGIKFGAEIIELNDVDIYTFLETVPIIWAESIPATNEGRKLNQLRFAGRAPVGDTIKLKYKNPGDVDYSTVELTAVDDQFETLIRTTMSTSRGDLPFITYEILSNRYGYIRSTSCGMEDDVPAIYGGFRTAMEDLISADVPGLIFDLRINEGGAPQIASIQAAFFYTDTTFYEYTSYYDAASGEFKIPDEPQVHINSQTFEPYINLNYEPGSLYVEPVDINFDKPVIVLIGPNNISSGEGLANALQKLPQCKTLGFYGTHGSFGNMDLAMEVHDLPSKLHVYFANGRSLDINKIIQIDSDAIGVGGIIPDIRIPLNETTINRKYLEEVDVELEYAIEELDRLTGIEGEEVTIPQNFKLSQNYPNPFNPTTNIEYSILKEGHVKLEVYDMLGRKVKTLVDEPQGIGWHKTKLDASNLASGIYFYRLHSGSFVETRKMMFVK